MVFAKKSRTSGLKVSPLSGEVLLERQDWIVLHVDCSITTLRGLQQVGTPAAHKETWLMQGGTHQLKTVASRTVAKHWSGSMEWFNGLVYTVLQEIAVENRKPWRFDLPLVNPLVAQLNPHHLKKVASVDVP